MRLPLARVYFICIGSLDSAAALVRQRMALRQADRSDKFDVITLAAGTFIPDGCNDESLGLIQRSLQCTPLAEQSRIGVELASALEVSLARDTIDWPSELAGFDLAGFSATHLNNGYPPDLNIANRIALGFVARDILVAEHGLLLMAAVLAFFHYKQGILTQLQDELSPKYGSSSVYIPESLRFFSITDAQSASSPSQYLMAAGINLARWELYICENLAIIRLPTKQSKFWGVTLIPNVIGGTQVEIGTIIAAFYHLQGLTERRGLELQPSDVKNFTDSLPSRVGPAVNYMIAKFCTNPLTLAALGLNGSKHMFIIFLNRAMVVTFTFLWVTVHVIPRSRAQHNSPLRRSEYGPPRSSS